MKNKKKKANIYQIADATGVSTATVSRVLNNRGAISTDTRDKVIRCMEKLNYKARPYIKGTLNIGILIETENGSIQNYTAEIINGVLDFATRYNYNTSIFSITDKRIMSTGLTYFLRANSIDGLIVLLSGKNSEYIESLSRERFPYILLNNNFSNGSYNYIDTNNYSGTQEAIEYLIQLGHKNILNLAGYQEMENHRIRIKSYKDTLKKHKIKINNDLIYYDLPNLDNNSSLFQGYHKVRDALNRNIYFTAIFAGNDDAALGAIRAIREEGLKVPEDISIIGFDDYEISSFITPPLTTVKQPLKKMGFDAAGNIISMINDITMKVQEIYNTNLIIRDSCCQVRERKSENKK